MTNPFFSERNGCPSCKSNVLTDIFQNKYDEDPIKEYIHNFYSSQGTVEFEFLQGAVYRLQECEDCGLIFQKYIPNDFFMGKLYGEWIDQGKLVKIHHMQDGLALYSLYAQEIMQLIAHFKTAPSLLNIFDFGMGLGQWALMAKAFGCNAFGLELTKERVESAKCNGISVIEWDDIPACQFDFINTEQVFEHLSEPLSTLVHLAKSLKPNGIIKISVPTANNIEKRLKLMDWSATKSSKYSLNPVAPLEHINFFRRKSILKMASLAGLKEVYIPVIKQYQHVTNWSGFIDIALNLLQPIRRNLFKNVNYCLFQKL
jgi:SAM-dependent methyltransferase